VSAPLELGVADLSRALGAGSLSALELTGAALDALDNAGRRLNAVLRLLGEEAIRDARASDSRRLAGRPHGPLDGIPFGVKDLIDVGGVPTTAGAGFPLDGVGGEPPWTAGADAFVVARLRSAGMIPVAKLHTHEWALGVTSVNPHFGPCHNPAAPDRIPGGSSGGSAAAVLARLVPAALGSDTGGSIRIPAALCGVYGLKPTHGRLSVRGVVPLSWTLDHVGPLARGTEDLALLAGALDGRDPLDPIARTPPAGRGAAPFAVRLATAVRAGQTSPGTVLAKTRIGVPEHDLWADLTQGVRAAVEPVLGALADAGARLGAVSGVDWAHVRKTAGTILLSDAAAYHEERVSSAPERFGPDVLRRLRSGAAIPAAEVARAHHDRSVYRHSLEALFDEFDILITPTTRSQAIRIDEAEGVSAAADYTRFTAPFNLLGWPALSMPVPVAPVAGAHEQSALPVGLQLVAAPWREDVLLGVCAALETLLAA
jgi:aspartyl-tRNA(Asn)/glutamyl-tRNA(Gln) amidotransferase subunit A